MDFYSKLLAQAVDEMSLLPGIGKRTALRLVLHLLKQPKQRTQALSAALSRLREEIRFCEQCHNVSDQPLCAICANSHRDSEVICVVEDIRDVMAIENTSQFRGVYHVLGGEDISYGWYWSARSYHSIVGRKSQRWACARTHICP